MITTSVQLQIIQINQFFDMDLAIEINVEKEQRLDPPTVIFKFRSKKSSMYVLIYNCESNNELVFYSLSH